MKYIETTEQRIQKILNKKTQATMLQRHTDVLRLQSKIFGSVAVNNQEKLLNDSTDLEKGLRMMMEGIEHYCVGASAVGDGTPIGQDGYCGAEVANIINALIALLSGPGSFDGGTCDAALRAIAKKYEVEGVDQ